MAQTLRRIVGSTAFDTVIIAVILANAVVLGLQTYPGVVAEHGDTLDLLNGVFLGIFVVELLLRIGSYWQRPQDFFRGGWNVFDFVVVGSAFLPVCARARRSCGSPGCCASSGSSGCCPTCGSCCKAWSEAAAALSA